MQPRGGVLLRSAHSASEEGEERGAEQWRGGTTEGAAMLELSPVCGLKEAYKVQ